MAITATASLPIRLLYGAYAWFVLIFLASPVVVACLLLPGLERRRRIARWGAAMTFRLIGSRIEVRGEPPADDAVAVVIANHQSYLDGIILTAVLPPHYTFLIKREMVRVPIAGFILERLGSEFVDRSNPNQRHRSARRLLEAAGRGRALAVFPEGTFDRPPGLKPFHMGAFRAAWRAGLPVAPIVITGARAKLPADVWLPRPGPIAVEFRPVIGTDTVGDEHELMRETRAAILSRLGEPDLDAPAPLWTPSPAQRESSRLHEFGERYAPDCTGYDALHFWSVKDPASFWSAVGEFCGLKMSTPPSTVVSDFERMPGTRWFDGARLNYAENLLAGNPDRVAIVFCNERDDRREMTLGELRERVAAVAAAMKSLGVAPGDRVAGVLPNSPECVIAMLATATIGAIWSSCSPDFGAASLYDRLGQIAPKVVFGVDGYYYAGKTIDCVPTLCELAGRLPTVETIILTRYAGSASQPDDGLNIIEFDRLATATAEIEFEQLPFDHPLFIMFSSGTTGPPKCIVHGTGGTLLQHMKEHQLHSDIKPGDRVFYYTTVGWMMWNWLVSALGSGATLVLYDGAPLHPDAGVLWRMAEREGLNIFGTSARYLSALEKSGFAPADAVGLDELRAVLSTGSPLAPSSFDFVYQKVKPDLMLASIAGGTDLISCFVLGNPMQPVYRGEIQCRGLGMDVQIFDADGEAVFGEKGELVCASPFPSMPLGFWQDEDGSAYARAYFERFPGVWHHGDFAELTAHGGIIMHGRSDSTLNPGGVRIGTAEIYRILERVPEVSDSVVVGQQWDGDTRVVLFVALHGTAELTEELETTIRKTIRSGASPHHVPALIVAVGDIPRTLNGKTSERAVSDAIHGREIGNLTALANPDSLQDFRARPELRT